MRGKCLGAVFVWPCVFAFNVFVADLIADRWYADAGLADKVLLAMALSILVLALVHVALGILHALLWWMR